MSINRFIVVLPVVAGLVVTGSAVARMMPRQSVRDTVYQTCAHNGVHFNKQGHANCGLHLGWSNGSTGDTQGGEPGSTESTTTTTTGAGHGHKGQGKTKVKVRGSHGTAVHGHSGDVSHGHSGTVSHGSATHGHSGHGGGRGHNKG
jgi:hypothetical protein